jgi:glycosyltransferase involved in cell wall biosynthesis
VPLGECAVQYGIQAGKYVIFVGRLVECKRVDHLIRAFRSSSTGLKLVVVGDGPEKIVKSLRDEAGADDRIVFTGALHGKTLRRVFSNAGLFVLPSVLEGLPVSLIEALSYNLPVMISDIAENLEVVQDGSNYRAIVTRADDAESLRLALGAALLDVEGLRRLGLGNAEFICAKYDWDSIATKTLECYEHALGQGNEKVKYPFPGSAIQS